jgi:hypothetical protein
MSMQIDSEFKKEQIGTLFVLAGGTGWRSRGKWSPKGIHTKFYTSTSFLSPLFRHILDIIASNGRTGRAHPIGLNKMTHPHVVCDLGLLIHDAPCISFSTDADRVQVV